MVTEGNCGMRSVFARTPWDTMGKTGFRGAGLGSPQARKLPRQPREPCSQLHRGRDVEGVGVQVRDPGSGGCGGVGTGDTFAKPGTQSAKALLSNTISLIFA